MKKRRPLRNEDYFDNLVKTFVLHGNLDTKEEAIEWLLSHEFEYQDNNRFTFLDDPEGVQKYKEQLSRGCCGYFDAGFLVGGKRALVGCNYGH